MNRIFVRDVIIAALLSMNTALLFEELCLMYCLILPYLFLVIGVEEYAERLIGLIHSKRVIKKLRNRKVLPPASKQD